MLDVLSRLWGYLFKRWRTCRCGHLGHGLLHVAGFCVASVWFWLAGVCWGVEV